MPPEKVPSASGLSNFARITAGSFAASAITTYWDRREVLHQSRLVEAANTTGPIFHSALDRLQGLSMSSLQGMATVTNRVITQAYIISSLDLFYVSAWASVACIGLVWVARRPQPPPASALPPPTD